GHRLCLDCFTSFAMTEKIQCTKISRVKFNTIIRLIQNQNRAYIRFVNDRIDIIDIRKSIKTLFAYYLCHPVLRV
ncbi:MAG: hypothetical protein LBJ47_07280, partial [Tannerella sp.]|nr:hypothetical protein [Tannerella sp.]